MRPELQAAPPESPRAVLQPSDEPPIGHGSPGPDDGRYTSRYSPETASPGELLCLPGEDKWRDGCVHSDRLGFLEELLPIMPLSTSPRTFMQSWRSVIIGLPAGVCLQPRCWAGPLHTPCPAPVPACSSLLVLGFLWPPEWRAEFPERQAT